jgi:Flp pilus assembly protein TadG
MMAGYPQGCGSWRLVARLRSRLDQVRRSGAGSQSGSAIVEFVFLAVLMIVPLFYLVMVLARLQAGAYGVSAAAREAGRAYVTAQAPAQAAPRARSAAGLAFADQGFDDREGSIQISCAGTPCLRPAGRITITARVWVPMPLVPAFFYDIVPTRVQVTATHVATVDRFGGQ